MLMIVLLVILIIVCICIPTPIKEDNSINDINTNIAIIEETENNNESSHITIMPMMIGGKIYMMPIYHKTEEE